jgi:hypothetical protein
MTSVGGFASQINAGPAHFPASIGFWSFIPRFLQFIKINTIFESGSVTVSAAQLPIGKNAFNAQTYRSRPVPVFAGRARAVANGRR